MGERQHFGEMFMLLPEHVPFRGLAQVRVDWIWAKEESERLAGKWSGKRCIIETNPVGLARCDLGFVVIEEKYSHRRSLFPYCHPHNCLWNRLLW